MSNQIMQGMNIAQEQHKMKAGFQKKGLAGGLLYPTRYKRIGFFVLLDFILISLSLFFSFFIRFEFSFPLEYEVIFFNALPLFLFIKILLLACFGIYKISWRYFGLNDFTRMAISQVVSLFILYAFFKTSLSLFSNVPIAGSLSFVSSLHAFPRSVFFIDWFVSLFLFSGLRVARRAFLENIRTKNGEKYGKKTLVIGAGNTGEMITRGMKIQGNRDYYPVGFLDKDANKFGTCIHGLKVFGDMDKLHHVVSKYGIEAIIIAIPSLNYKDLRRMYALAKDLRIDTIKIVPRIYDLHNPSVNIKNLEDIQTEDLLGRQAVEIDCTEIDTFLKHKVILITGAGGSIGSELAIQVCAFQPEKVILLDIDETELHQVNHKLERLFPHLFDRTLMNSRIQDKVILLTGDIRDVDVVNEIFEKFKPRIVFHAAAYKHVPIMEINCKEAVKTNMFGTYNLVKAAAHYHAEKFILISTDKAVRPTSIMGATKRMAEYICTAFHEDTETSFIAVRFGNVLGSRGSVVPTFLEQLKHGGPITITHKDIERFFMTIPEAVSLVLQAAVLGKNGNILVLDMGEPVKILNLAEELIRIHGLRPYKDIDIQFIGLRAGEKLFEETLSAEEGTTASKHKKIFIAKQGKTYSKDEIEMILRGFAKLLKVLPIMDNYEIIRDVLRKYVKSFERRGYRRQNQQWDEIDSELSQSGDAYFQHNKMQFEKLLGELPAIEDYEIIRDALSKYLQSLEKRRQGKISQTSETAAPSLQRIEPSRKYVSLLFGKKRYFLSFLDKSMEEELKEHVLFSQHSPNYDYLLTVGYQDNGNVIEHGESLYFKGEKWHCHSNGNGEMTVLFPRNRAFPNTMRILALLYNEFYKREDNSFILHAAGLCKHKKGFIFTGESGAGKTIISKLSSPEAEVLSDESVIVSKDSEGYWISQGPIKTEITIPNEKRVRLFAIFILVKDNVNLVRRLTLSEIIHKLMDNLFYVNFSERRSLVDEMEKRLRYIHDVYRHVAVYELRFKNDNSFWQEIERVDLHR